MKKKTLCPEARRLLAGTRPIGLLTVFQEEGIEKYCADIERITLQKGQSLIHLEDPLTDVFIVVKGKLKAVMTLDDGTETIVGEICPGEPAGEMQIFGSGKRSASVHATGCCELLKLPHKTFEKLAVKSPRFVRRMAAISRRRLRTNQVFLVLSRFLGRLNAVDLDYIQANTHWAYLKRGELLFKQGDPGDSLCVLISGRLIATVTDSEGIERPVGEVRQGELVGEMAILTGADRSASVYALRDSLLAIFSNEAIQQIIAKYPQVMMHTARTVIARLSKSIHAQSQSDLMKSIAVVPAGPGVPIRDFINRLNKSLAGYTSTLHLNSERLDSLIGIHGIAQTAEDNPYDNRLSTALDEQSTKVQLILFECDTSVTPWTRRCIRQADQIMIVANAEETTAPGELERFLQNYCMGITAARQSLVLIHKDGTALPSGTDMWLEGRELDAHYHVRWNLDDDFERLARTYTGNAIGLVLGGGGARGLAHIGVVRALMEEGIPIDMIGGCSIGSVIAALPAMKWDYDTMLKVTTKFFVKKNPVGDYTLPLHSIIRGKRLERALFAGMGDANIEDLWIPYFCVSSNMSSAGIRIHREGLLRKAIRSSIAIPGMIPPVLEGNDLLIDGGILNNLPADVMAGICKGRVIAVDVNPKKEYSMQRSTIPSPWEVIRGRIAGSSDSSPMPSLVDILTRSTMLGSALKTEEVKENLDLYLQPPIDKFGLLEFSALAEIAEIGYQYTKKRIRGAHLQNILNFT